MSLLVSIVTPTDPVPPGLPGHPILPSVPMVPIVPNPPLIPIPECMPVFPCVPTSGMEVGSSYIELASFPERALAFALDLKEVTLPKAEPVLLPDLLLVERTCGLKKTNISIIMVR
eukprot:CAMPEP_0173205456 /NCGR_PEP_ID=MMETSP1141-20130122/20759_1 /TAXON_ID=483371 /ORGANISM="non described non described, Strain CCMP2298" /LENGTH=115 /DNA_ID=CAMNT_0014131375 /DNA_START=139 /DNA_END=486 /DNA_ORIENTATION=+